MRDKKTMKSLEKERKQMIKNWGPRHFTNMLDEMMSLQEKFGSKFCKFDDLSEYEKTRWTKEFILCIQDELCEVLNWTPWKHWKQYHGKPADQLEIQYELVDILHFLLDLMLIWKMTPRDVFSIYLVKNRENHRRQEAGY